MNAVSRGAYWATRQPFWRSKFDVESRLLTSDELASERNGIIDAEAALRPHGKTILLLIKANVADFICTSRCSSSHFIDLNRKSLCVSLYVLELESSDGRNN